jgi:hypothetical protein
METFAILMYDGVKPLVFINILEQYRESGHAYMFINDRRP